MKRKYDISLIRILATFAVILLHTCSTLLDNPDKFLFSSSEGLFLEIVSYSMRWAVPVFFMLTGILLLDCSRVITAEICIKKYVFRMLLVLVIFGLPFAAIKDYMERRSIDFQLVSNAVFAVINDDGWRHLWYIYYLIGLYLVLPVIKQFTDNSSGKDTTCILLCLFFFCCVTPFIDAVAGTSIGVVVPFSYPIFYLMLGKKLSENNHKLLNNKLLIMGVLVLFITVLVLIEVFAHSVIDAVRAYDSPIIAVIASMVYLLFKDVDISEKNGQWLWQFDRMCFGAYIIHPVFIHLSYKFLGVTPLQFKLYPLFIMLFFLSFVLLAFGGSFVLRLIKPIRKYVL